MGEHVFKKPLLIQCNKDTRREIQQNVVKKIPKKTADCNIYRGRKDQRRDRWIVLKS